MLILVHYIKTLLVFDYSLLRKFYEILSKKEMFPTSERNALEVSYTMDLAIDLPASA